MRSGEDASVITSQSQNHDTPEEFECFVSLPPEHENSLAFVYIIKVLGNVWKAPSKHVMAVMG